MTFLEWATSPTVFEGTIFTVTFVPSIVNVYEPTSASSGRSPRTFGRSLPGG